MEIEDENLNKENVKENVQNPCKENNETKKKNTIKDSIKTDKVKDKNKNAKTKEKNKIKESGNKIRK
jgi:hypothetical protein